jgi:hypothetical protein
MNPNSGEKNLPGFGFEELPEGSERRLEKAMEKPGPVQEGADPKSVKTPSMPTPTMPVPTPSTTTGTSKGKKAAHTSDLPAHDVDLIEKQWVERAKTIVNQTQDDPYVQKKEISKAGADYIKKRFNKTIPTDDAAKA